MNQIEPTRNLLGQEIPHAPLYHYTSVEGLKGMVAGKTFWATNIEYLNDSSEFRHGADVIAAVLKKRRRGARSATRGFFEVLDKIPPVFEPQDIFVVSLSEVGDLLSQWRGYTPNGLGFSIGFDPWKLRHAFGSLHTAELVRCAYSDEEKDHLAGRFIDSCLDSWKRRNSHPDVPDSGPVEFSVIPPGTFRLFESYFAASMKHASFAEEREWRLIFLSRRNDQMRFRSGKSSLVPYVELNWAGSPGSDIVQPLHSLIVGPCPNPGLSKRSAHRLFEVNGVQGAHVTNSRIPFRAW